MMVGRALLPDILRRAIAGAHQKMAIFGAYETSEELERTPFSVVFKASQADGKTRSPFIIKSLDLDATAVDPQTLDAKNQQFLSAVRVQQKISDRSGTCHWAPVHDVGTVRGRAFYVSDFYPRTVAGMIKGRVKVSPRALYSVIRGVILGLQELNQYCRRPHGNLKAPNILIADPDLDPTEVYLSDPCADEQLPAESADAADMKALGRLIYQLVTHRPFPEVGGWPIQPNAEWHRLGRRRGKDWLAFANQLLDPLTEKPMTLDDAAAAIKKLGAPPLLSTKHLAAAAVIAVIAVGTYFTYKFIQSGGLAPRANAQANSTQPATPETKADQPPRPPRVDPITTEIQAHRSEIDKRLSILEASRDPLLARFASLLESPPNESLPDSNRRLADLDNLSKDLAAAAEKDFPNVDRQQFIQEAKIHQDTKSKTTLIPDDFRSWLKEVKDPQFARLDAKLDPRKTWQPGLRSVRLRLDELRQMTPAAAEAAGAEVEKLSKAITQTRERRWNTAQRPVIEQEIKDIDARVLTLSTNIETTIQNQQTADTKLAQLRGKLASNSLILTNDSLQAEWDKARQEILETLKKDPAQIDALSKKTTDLHTRLSRLDQTIAESAKLLKTNDFIPAIAKLDDLSRAYPEDRIPRDHRSSLAAPLYDRGQKFLKGEGVKADQSEAYRCLLLSAGLGEARAARMLGRIPPEIGVSSKDSPALLDLFKKSADTGDAPAMNIVGFMYENGWGAAADPKLAIDYYTKSANANFGGAMNNLGFLHYSGRGVPQDNKKAFEWFSKGAAAGYAASMKNLGTMYQNGHGVKADGAQAAQWYRKAADANDVSAMTRLGILYEEGKDTPRDYKQSATWYRKAAEAGEGRAMLGLGNLLENGLGLDRDEADAANWYRKAIAAGEVGALGRLANLLEQGRGVAKDEAEAFKLYHQAADAGDPIAMAALADMYASGRGTTKSEAEAFKWYSKAADANEPSALRTLGLMYADGRGTAKDPKKAIDLFKRAADAGDPLAAKDLGMIYLRGDGVDKNPTEAAKWMSKAADAGEPAAMSNLGVMYLNGQGVAKDEKKALELFRKAADAGNAGAMANLGVMYKNGRGVAKDLFEAFEWYRKAAEAKDTLAMNNLGLMYQSGQGTKRDYPAALRWFKSGADAGDAAAMNNLGIMYELGQGVARDPAEAAKWFKAAAAAGEPTAQKNLDRLQNPRTTTTNPPRRDRISNP
jgi:TPR repeat protein